MTLIPGVASAGAPVVNEIGETRDMQVLVLGRHWRSGRRENGRRQIGNRRETGDGPPQADFFDFKVEKYYFPKGI